MTLLSFKRITPISKNEVKALLKVSRAMAMKYKFNKKDVAESVSGVRKSKKRKQHKNNLYLYFGAHHYSNCC